MVLGFLLLFIAVAGGPPASASRPAQPPPLLSVSATASPLSGAVPLTVAFVAHASNGFPPYSYSWSFGDLSANVTGPFANHTFRTIAVFLITVTVGDSAGAVANATLEIAVNPAPLGVSLSAAPSALAAGQPTLLETSVAGGLAPFHFTWTGLPVGCPPQSVENLSCTPRYGGSYVVNVTVTDSRNLSASATVALVVSGAGPPPPPTVGPTSPDYTVAIVAVALGAAILVVVAAIIGRRARRRRAEPRA